MIHGGNLRLYKEISGKNNLLDFSANINPLGYPEWIRPLINSEISNLIHYPDFTYLDLKKAIASYHSTSKENITLGNGTAESLMIIPRALELKEAFVFDPGFYQYERCLKANKTKITKLSLGKDFQFDFSQLENKLSNSSSEAVIIGHPHNPTGTSPNIKELKEFIKKFPNTSFIIDEAFIEFTEIESFENFSENVIVLRSLTKILAIPGLRLGYTISNKEVAEKIEEQTPEWNLNQFSQKIGLEFFTSNPKTFLSETKEKLKELKEYTLENLKRFPIKTYSGEANYILLECLNSDAKNLWETLLTNYGIALRKTDSFLNLDENKFLRLAIRPKVEIEQLLMALGDYFKVSHTKARKKPALMLQGTTSNAGKSILSTAICRILYQDGFNVMPFKSQNMALNSYVTKDGGEIGRAQAVQAMACKKDPTILMNPILLKPNSDIGSQVIINGKPISHMNFKDYFKFKPKAFTYVKEAYDEISAEADIMVIEGAGSPSEVNLKKNDIVNMNMAKYAKADVYMAADIDRGGMFASFLGTFDTLSEWERGLVKGLIINRFRGDRSLLDSGIDYLHKFLNIPVLGCIPYVKNHNIPEEDCIEFKSGVLDDRTELGDRVDIAVIDTPRISNFSDIDALKEEPDVKVRIVRNLSELGTPHLILLCGSKSVMRDLEYLKESGIAAEILKLHKDKGTPIVGICGGYQMLGQAIKDPNHIESDIEFMEGLSLLPIETTLEEEKLLGQTKAMFTPWNQTLTGYEIHHGSTLCLNSSAKPIVISEKKEVIGYSSLNKTVWGSYLHGIFDEDEFRREFINFIRVAHGKPALTGIQSNYDVDKSIDYFAKVVRDHLDMDIIYKNLGI